MKRGQLISACSNPRQVVDLGKSVSHVAVNLQGSHVIKKQSVPGLKSTATHVCRPMGYADAYI